MRRAKIVCTLGPASSTRERIGELIEAGMNCARLNFSHGDHATHARAANWVREAAAERNKPVALLADLGGPKIRIGTFKDGGAVLDEGSLFTLSTEDVVGDASRVHITYSGLPQDVLPGDILLLADGLLRLRVESAGGTEVVTRVEVGGQLTDKKGLNVPGRQLSIPSLTEKDLRDLDFAVDQLKVDYLALSFVRRSEDIVQAQKLAKGTPIIAKIEKPEALENLTKIIEAADGVMVARGDLGVELGAEKVPIVQKRVIREVRRQGKLVITATEMLESMIRNPRPTRAEAADVANAVLDGTDAVMLSAETAAGKYPVQTVRMMDAIVREAEQVWLADGIESRNNAIEPLAMEGWEFANAAARAAAVLSTALPLKAIVTFTRDGRSARLLSDYRPRAPVIAITTRSDIANQLVLAWGVYPHVELPPEDLHETLRTATALLAREGVCRPGDAFALVVGWPTSSGTNTVKLHRM